MKKHITIMLIVMLTFFGCKDNSTSTENTVETTTPTEILVQTITHDDFSVAKPKSWKEAVLPQARLYKYFPPEVNSTDPRPENIMIVVDNAPKDNKSIEQIVDIIIEGSQKANPDMKVIDKPKAAKLGPLEGVMIGTERTFDREKMRSVQIFAKTDKKMYVMTYSCEVGNCKNYYVFDIMAESFHPL